jgi:ligand-binding SRPBCC domain-containing protein
MAYIQLKTYIKAPVQVCFDLSRSIELHTEGMQHTREKAVAGITSGLIGPEQTVTWEARHFGLTMRLTSKITRMRFSDYFRDEMQAGPFKSMAHDHLFIPEKGGTVMIDDFEFYSPCGVAGKLADFLILKHYMRRLLKKRNHLIQRVAEAQAKQG